MHMLLMRPLCQANRLSDMGVPAQTGLGCFMVAFFRASFNSSLARYDVGKEEEKGEERMVAITLACFTCFSSECSLNFLMK